jgi:hypothetical protein
MMTQSKIYHLGTGKTDLDKSLYKVSRILRLDIRTNSPPLGKTRSNAGDKLLTRVFQDLIKKELGAKQAPFLNVRRIFNIADINSMNESNAIILGGGGLFLCDTFSNIVSDWQWGISPSLLNKIEVPLIVHSVGYNRFRNQRGFTTQFDKSVSALLEKSALFSMRHQGDIEKLKKHVPKQLHKKINMVYCPTLTFNNKYPKLSNTYSGNNMGFLFAGDRLGCRHKDPIGYLRTIKEFKIYVEAQGIQSILIMHDCSDKWVLKYIDFDQVIDLSVKTPEEILQTYSSFDYVISDRGHSQMIPFSVGCKIITPISHDKLKFFLEDIKMPQLGVEESDPNLLQKLKEILNGLQDTAAYQKSQNLAMNKIISNEDAFISKIKKLVGVSNR